MKQCARCEKVRPLSEFYTNKSHRICKICHREYTKCWREENREKSRMVSALWKKDNPDKVALQYKRYVCRRRKVRELFHLLYPEHRKARDTVKRAIKTDKLPRPNTLQCYYGNHPAKEYHHWRGYEPKHWLNVIPVCILCHGIVR